MTWTFTGNTNLSVSITDSVATVSVPNSDWNGTETIVFRATDPGSLWDDDAVTFTVTGVNDAPVVSVIYPIRQLQKDRHLQLLLLIIMCRILITLMHR